MNTKLIAKTLFLIVLLLLLVLIGLENQQTVEFKLPPILPKAVRFQAAIMYFSFFAVGVLAGTILTGGRGRGSGGGGKAAGSSR